jgi:hypothetical protein
LCGYCPNSNPTPPQSWESCRKCLYPSASSDASAKDTLKVDNDSNIPVTPEPGKYYTQVGCITTGGGFTQVGAGGSVVQILLNVIFGLSGGTAFLYLIYGAFLVMTSQANPERLNHGRRVVQGAIIGVLFVIGAVFIVNFIGAKVLKIPGFN